MLRFTGAVNPLPFRPKKTNRFLTVQFRPFTPNTPFWQEVRTLGATHRRLPRELSLDAGQVAVLNDYLYANELYLRCLEIAAVNDREAFRALTLPLPADLS